MAEKECGICGKIFEVTNGNQKYCPDCRENSSYKKMKMERSIKRSIRTYGYGNEDVLHEYECQNCGKKFKYPKYRKFCTKKCEDTYRIKNAECTNCGKNLYQMGVEINPKRYINYCSDKCKHDHRYRKAKKREMLAVCPTCGKEFIKNTRNRTYCCYECYKNSTSKPRRKQTMPTESECIVCGKKFTLDKHRSIVCSEECRKNYVRQTEQRVRDNEAKRKEQKFQKYVQENGLCGICKTSYKSCERMKSNFIYSPEGAVFNGKLIVQCPKFKK